MTRSAPVINCASIEDKKITPFAISKGSPTLLNGVILLTLSFSSKPSLVFVGWSIYPGLFEIQRIYRNI
jgi:hypothetical protein